MEARDLLRQLTNKAEADARQTLAAASRALDVVGPHPLRAGEPDPRVVLAVAERLLDSGPLINYVRAEELGRFVVAYYDFASPRPTLSGAAAKKPRVDSREPPARLLGWIAQLRAMWRRAPLLLLMLSWFLLGLVGGILSVTARSVGLASADSSTIGLGFEIWGIGFLVLIGYGFYRSIRRLR
jgi:hypothetical protein